VLEVMLKQIDGTYDLQEDAIKVIPIGSEKKHANRRASARRAKVENELRKKLARRVDFEKGIADKTPLKDALELIRKEHDLNILIDTGAFQFDQKRLNISREPVKLPELKAVPLATALTMLLKPIKADYQIIDNLILIVPYRLKETS
jgi:hypothetical protein